MVIDFRKAEIFEGKMAQARNSVVGGQLSLSHSLKKFADGLSVQRTPGTVFNTWLD